MLFIYSPTIFPCQRFPHLTYSPPQLFPATCFCCYHIFLQDHCKWFMWYCSSVSNYSHQVKKAVYCCRFCVFYPCCHRWKEELHLYHQTVMAFAIRHTEIFISIFIYYIHTIHRICKTVTLLSIMIHVMRSIFWYMSTWHVLSHLWLWFRSLDSLQYDQL